MSNEVTVLGWSKAMYQKMFVTADQGVRDLMSRDPDMFHEALKILLRDPAQQAVILVMLESLLQYEFDSSKTAAHAAMQIAKNQAHSQYKLVESGICKGCYIKEEDQNDSTN